MANENIPPMVRAFADNAANKAAPPATRFNSYNMLLEIQAYVNGIIRQYQKEHGIRLEKSN